MTTPGAVAELPHRSTAASGSAAPVRRSRADVAAFACVCGVIAALRLAEMRSAGAPATVDTGNWIAWGDALLGRPSELEPLGYPPLVPVLVKLATGLFGLTDGIALLGALASLAPGLGVFTVVRRFHPGLTATAAAVLVVASSSVGETTAWGGFPQLVGFGALVMFIADFGGFLAAPSRRTVGRAAAWLLVVAATSHFVLLAAVTSATGLLLVHLVRSGRDDVARSAARRLAPWLVVPSLWLVPTYVSLTSGILGNPDDSTALTKLTWSGIDDSVEFLYREAPWMWRLLLAATGISAAALLRTRRVPAMASVPLSLSVGMLSAIALTREVRYLYLIPIVAVLWIGVASAALQQSSRWRGVLPSLTAVLIVCAAVQIDRGLEFFDDQRSYYTVLTPSLVDALDYIEDATPADAVIATPAVGPDHPFGWWAEPLSGRRMIYGSPLRWLIFGDDVERARIGNAIFSADFPGGDTLDIARAAGVDYLLIPRSWVFFDADDIDGLVATMDSTDVVRFADADLIRIAR